MKNHIYIFRIDYIELSSPIRLSKTISDHKLYLDLLIHVFPVSNNFKHLDFRWKSVLNKRKIYRELFL